MLKVWMGRFLLLVTLAAVYAYGFELRRMEMPHWSASGYVIGGELMIPTNDGYYELLAADGGRTLSGTSVLGHMAALGRKISGWPLGNVGFLLPLIFAPLAALPPVWLLWRHGYHAGALAAGVFIASCPAYVARTRVGFFDTDMLNLFFPLLLASCLAAWLVAADADQDAEDNEWIRKNSAFLAYAFGIGLLAWAYLSFYPSGQVVAAALIASAALTACWTQRGRPAVVLAALGLLALAAWKPVPGLIGALALSALLRTPDIRWHAAALPAPLIFACLLPVAALFVPQMHGIIARAQAFISAYAANDPPMGEEAVHFGLNLANTYATVGEVQSLPPEAFSSAIVPVYFAFLLSVAGVFIMLKRRPQFFVFLPLIVLGFSSLFLGVRFAMYGAALGLGFGMAVSLFQRGDAGLPWSALSAGGRERRIVGHGLSWALALILCFAIGHSSMKMMRELRPGSFFSPEFGRALQSLDRRLPPGCVLWLWWDYGFNAQYFARRDSVADSRRNAFADIYLPGLAMSTDSSLQGSRIMRFVGDKAVVLRPVAGTRQVIYESSGAMRQLKAMGHEKAVALLEGFKSEPFASRPDAPAQYLVVSWEGLP
ncbi:MAG: hypothetical protein FWH26_11390, partial [Oscillospiraceae bacterium]|nr:hypothetical protein [Oscillospiraceae bacterium]